MGVSPTDTAGSMANLGAFDQGWTGNVPNQPSFVEVGKFAEALSRSGFGSGPSPVAPPVRIAQIDPTILNDGTTTVDRAGAATRAVQGLDLAEEAQGAGTGSTILDGLGRLRSVFDTQLDSIASSTSTNPMDAVAMMNLQAELVQFSVVVDVSSKLAGKSTQALDSLMKGQ